MKNTIYEEHSGSDVLHPRVKDLSGMEFSHLKVIRFHSISDTGNAVWECWCSRCGALELHKSRNILRGNDSRCSPNIPYNLNHNYFAYPEARNSYWAGFIAADGNIKQDKHTIRVTLHNKDSEHLMLLLRELSDDRLPFILPEKSQIGFAVSSTTMAKDLLHNYNITPNKSLTLLPPPNLNFINSVYFVAGYIDGDGCFGVNRDGNFFFHAMGTYKMMEYIRGVLSHYNSGNLRLSIYKSGKQSVLSSTGKKTLTLFQNFLRDFDKSFGMSRKWNYVN